MPLPSVLIGKVISIRGGRCKSSFGPFLQRGGSAVRRIDACTLALQGAIEPLPRPARASRLIGVPSRASEVAPRTYRLDWSSASPDALREGGTMLQLDWRDAHESLLLADPSLMISKYVQHETTRLRRLYSSEAHRPWSCATCRKLHLQNQRLLIFRYRFRAILSCNRRSDFKRTRTTPSVLSFCRHLSGTGHSSAMIGSGS